MKRSTITLVLAVLMPVLASGQNSSNDWLYNTNKQIVEGASASQQTPAQSRHDGAATVAGAILDGVAAGLNEYVRETELSLHKVLDLKNNTSKDMRFAFAFYDRVHRCFVSKGWYALSPYQSQKIDMGKEADDIYVFAEHVAMIASTRWEGDYHFCIDDYHPFTISYAEMSTCSKKRGFTRINLYAGENNFTFNP